MEIEKESTIQFEKFYEHMHTGTALVVETVSPKALLRVSSVFVGYMRGEYLIIDFPKNGEQLLTEHFKSGDELLIKAVTQTEYKDIIAFKTKVIAELMNPHPMLILELPTMVQYHKARHSPRIRANLPVRIMVDGHVEPASQVELMRDFSATGCLLEVNKTDFNLVLGVLIDIGKTIGVQLTTPLGVEEIISGEIVSIKKYDDVVTISLKFNLEPDGIDAEKEMRMHQDLFNQLFIMARDYNELD